MNNNIRTSRDDLVGIKLNVSTLHDFFAIPQEKKNYGTSLKQQQNLLQFEKTKVLELNSCNVLWWFKLYQNTVKFLLTNHL